MIGNFGAFYGSFLLFMFPVCHVFLSVHCTLVVGSWERADLLALLFMIFYCVFVTVPYGIQGQVWCLIVSIPDRCLLSQVDFLFNCMPAGRTSDSMTVLT